MKARHYSLLIAIGLLLLVSSGCDPLTRAHFDMIKVNVDTKSDVKELIGPPTNKLDDEWHYQRMDKHLEVFIDFNDKDVVTRKQWIGGEDEEWYDSQEKGDKPRYESHSIRTYDN